MSQKDGPQIDNKKKGLNRLNKGKGMGYKQGVGDE